MTAAVVRGAVVLTVCGDLDCTSGPRLCRFLTAACTAFAPRIVVDLAAVRFMDSAGLSILLTAHHRAAKAGGRLRLAGASEQVLAVLERVGVAAVIGAYPTVAAALA
ncbi:STAS domain-containing protein [Streptomyces sp. NPDC016845]|uniref:STAS domain-containing protein n=1 Tax=Streptomyces sp. NPDC016845 TaxID=3364972 RepID=UPI0037962A4F